MSDARFYDELIMDHIRNARNYRVLTDASHDAAGSNPLCGDEMRVYIRIDGRRIADAAFQCTCCGISMASASIMTTMLIGAATNEAQLLPWCGSLPVFAAQCCHGLRSSTLCKRDDRQSVSRFERA
jgi:nitrogen fixation NifU-like protein